MNIVYNASAGTGKTYQVTRLYEKLVMEDGIDPREILLMTFTENAAAELRMRVAQRLLKARKAAEKEDDDRMVERAMSASARLSSAPVGTIHSFCTSLLREHALEAGLSPGFTVLVGAERDELLQQICRDELLIALESDPDFRAFCAGAHVIGSGNGFGTSITETVPILIAQAGSIGISLEQAESLLPEPVMTVSRIDFEQIRTRLQAVPNSTPTVQTALDILRQALDETDDVEMLVTHLNELGIRKFGRGDANVISHDLWDLKTAVENAAAYRERFPAARAFARYVQTVVRRFQERKHALNAVDFDDQLRLAAKLLESGRAPTAFRYIIVDEVQDTSRIQCDIIQALWTGTGRRAARADTGSGDTARPPQTHLIICGDRKQSIYTWRGADPLVMHDLEQAILEAGGKREHLQTSYRSKTPILEVINALFTSVYGADEYTLHHHLQPNPDHATPAERPCIEYLAPDEDDTLTKPEKVAAEMAAVANRIRLLVDGEAKWQPVFRHTQDGFREVDDTNRYAYSDILILLRRTTHQSVLEQALRHADIPYTLGGKGRGLFTRQETRDVSLFLNALINPRDAFSLIGFLRSPWIGLSDTEIAELAWDGDGFSSDHVLSSYAQKTDVIDRYRALLGTRLVSELVRMLIDETGYDALLAGLPRGTQRLANLRKILDWLRETERGAHTTPATVARKLSEQIAAPPQIPEAALLDPAQNAVTIMTVHGAKGLTRRVVFVPDMNFSDNTDRGFAQVYFDGQHKPALGLRITAADRNSVKSHGFEEAGRQAADIRKHESSNLFYVAMTRARDLVVTSATPGRRCSGWLEQMSPLIGTAIPAIPYATLALEARRPTASSRGVQTAHQLAASIGRLPPTPEWPALERMPATRLAREADELETQQEYAEHPPLQSQPVSSAMGSLGHAVLEQFALNNWQGSVEEWLDILRQDFSISKAEALTLAERIRVTLQLMIRQTRETDAIRPEFPFVLREGSTLIDGTIDLLCQSREGYSVYDYKFTDAAADEVLETYRRQMEIYHRAAQHCCPDAATGRTHLIAISHKEVKCIPVLF